jgi:hypothetical protein
MQQYPNLIDVSCVASFAIAVCASFNSFLLTSLAHAPYSVVLTDALASAFLAPVFFATMHAGRLVHRGRRPRSSDSTGIPTTVP